MPVYSERLRAALFLAERAHRGQLRKGREVAVRAAPRLRRDAPAGRRGRRGPGLRRATCTTSSRTPRSPWTRSRSGSAPRRAARGRGHGAQAGARRHAHPLGRAARATRIDHLARRRRRRHRAEGRGRGDQHGRRRDRSRARSATRSGGASTRRRPRSSGTTAGSRRSCWSAARYRLLEDEVRRAPRAARGDHGVAAACIVRRPLSADRPSSRWSSGAGASSLSL